MPGLVTILCHAECLGAWTAFWAPCRGTWPFSSQFIALVGDEEDDNTQGPYESRLVCDIVSRTDVCGWRWHMKGKECMEATLEHL
eukprot:1743397-Amphidinium_carterae.1